MNKIEYEAESAKRGNWLDITGGTEVTVLDAFAIGLMPVAADEWRWAGKDTDDKKYKKLAAKAYEMAEAMLAERNKRFTPQNVVRGVTGKTYG